MTNGGNGERISVSREVLRAELAEMKLDLLTRLATKEEVRHQEQLHSALESRVSIVEDRIPTIEQQVELLKRIDRLEAWRSRLAGGLATLIIIVPIASFFNNWYFS
jgi:hypothetical protein